MRITARSRGAAVIGKNVGYLSDALKDALQDTVLEAAAPFLEEARIIVPVDTGALRDSIEASVIESTPTRAVARVAPDTPYAAYVEFGTGIAGAASPGAGNVPYSTTWPGMPAQPYMRPAWDAKRGAAADLLRDALRRNAREALVAASNEVAARRNARRS